MQYSYVTGKYDNTNTLRSEKFSFLVDGTDIPVEIWHNSHQAESGTRMKNHGRSLQGEHFFKTDINNVCGLTDYFHIAA